MNGSLYNGELVAGGLLVRESRLVADLMRKGMGKKNFLDAIVQDNILQKRSPAAARRQATLIWKRFSMLDPTFLPIIADGPHDQTCQAVFCAAIKHNHLVGDFILKVVSEHKRTFKGRLHILDWDRFFEDCSHIEPRLALWSDSTKAKIRQVVFRILSEAAVIDSARSKTIMPFYLTPEVEAMLRSTHEQYVLKCLEAIQ
jgi:hypothetical protein